MGSELLIQSDHSVSDVQTLSKLACERGFITRDVRGGGHCCFAAAAVGLSHLGITTTYLELRHQVCDYLRQHP